MKIKTFGFDGKPVRAKVAPVAFVLLLAACGSSTTSTGASTDQPANPPAAAATTADTQATEAAPATTEAAATEALNTDAAATEPAATDVAASTDAQPVANTKLDLNSLTEEQLMSTIPNFPNRMVREFFEYRPYVSIQQFRKEIGKYVDAATVAEYEKYVYVPVNVSEADEATLQQIPGVDANVAAQLVAARPYASNDAFLQKLGQLTSADVAAAAGYLEAK